MTEVHAKDLTLDKFLDAHLLADAPALPRAEREPRTVLLSGANGTSAASSPWNGCTLWRRPAAG